MRIISLTVAVNNEITSYKEGIMKEILEWIMDKGYHRELILDRTTKPLGIYFLMIHQKEIKLTKEECENFLDKYKSRGLEYKLIALEDAAELSFVSK